MPGSVGQSGFEVPAAASAANRERGCNGLPAGGDARYIPGARHVRAFGVEAMTGSSKSSDGLDPRRRRLLFRAWHRGSREMDLIVGRFADAWIERMSERELDDFERLIEMPDPDLFSLVVEPVALPASDVNELLRRLRAFHSVAGDPT
jgi:antitoxin CptB